MEEDVQQFINNNWNYYLMLENDFINITRYIKSEKLERYHIILKQLVIGH